MFPIRNFNYTMTIDGIDLGFSEVSGYDAKVQEIPYREGNHGPNTVRKLQGLLEYGQITLKRGTDDVSGVLFDWLNEADSKEVTRKTVTVTALDDEKKPAASWRVINAWPVNYSISDFKGDGNEVVVETLVLTHEGMVRES